MQVCQQPAIAPTMPRGATVQYPTFPRPRRTASATARPASAPAATTREAAQAAAAADEERYGTTRIQQRLSARRQRTAATAGGSAGGSASSARPASAAAAYHQQHRYRMHQPVFWHLLPTPTSGRERHANAVFPPTRQRNRVAAPSKGRQETLDSAAWVWKCCDTKTFPPPSDACETTSRG
jgi:hypothetical protein